MLAIQFFTHLSNYQKTVIHDYFHGLNFIFMSSEYEFIDD